MVLYYSLCHLLHHWLLLSTSQYLVLRHLTSCLPRYNISSVLDVLNLLLGFIQSDDKNTRWTGAGINIDIDNLLTSPAKTIQPSSAPSMNQMAKGTAPSPSQPPPPPSSSSSSSFTSPPSFASGPNYNVNTASLMGPTRPQPGMGIGGGGMGMAGGGVSYGGMGMSSGGMGMAGGMGYGPRPGMAPMYGGGGYGMGPQPGMGMGQQMSYGGMQPTMGGTRPMGAQQKLI